MGVEKSFQAIPGNCDLIQRAREDADVGSLLGYVPIWIRDGLPHARYAGWPEAERFAGMLRTLIEMNPGLEKRNCHLDRRWDILHFLLSANRRRERGGEIDAYVDLALNGAEIIGGQVRGTQGVPVRYTNPSQVELIAAALTSMTKRQMKKYNNPARMQAHAVYKAFGNSPHRWQTLCEDFAALRGLYVVAAEHGEGVIVCLD